MFHQATTPYPLVIPGHLRCGFWKTDERPQLQGLQAGRESCWSGGARLTSQPGSDTLHQLRVHSGWFAVLPLLCFFFFFVFVFFLLFFKNAFLLHSCVGDLCLCMTPGQGYGEPAWELDFGIWLTQIQMCGHLKPSCFAWRASACVTGWLTFRGGWGGLTLSLL